MAGKSRDPLFDFCRSLPGVTEDVKWEKNLVFSVGEKMFCVFGLPEGESMSFKVDGETFEALTQRPGVEPAPYLARHSWIRLATRDALPGDFVEELIERSHGLVAAKLPKRVRASLKLDDG